MITNLYYWLFWLYLREITYEEIFQNHSIFWSSSLIYSKFLVSWTVEVRFVCVLTSYKSFMPCLTSWSIERTREIWFAFSRSGLHRTKCHRMLEECGLWNSAMCSCSLHISGQEGIPLIRFCQAHQNSLEVNVLPFRHVLNICTRHKIYLSVIVSSSPCKELYTSCGLILHDEKIDTQRLCRFEA